jgi:hypothetical protein
LTVPEGKTGVEQAILPPHRSTWMKKALAILLVIGCGKDAMEPDGIWKVTVSNTDDDCQDVLDYGDLTGSTTMDDICGTDCEGADERFTKTFEYQLFFDGRKADLRIDDQHFASGPMDGCKLSYETPVWMESRSRGDVQWSIKATDTTVQGEATCDRRLREDLDWVGYEIVTVVESEDPKLAPGCTYSMATVGKYVGTGD